ncbi:MAG: ImmA/IrrE family metallo-endopeptidase [Phycisphaerae bacterium]|nr:ImmA/IrrE family metallo-endopeptidase [Phycisphaerae bacterium]
MTRVEVRPQLLRWATERAGDRAADIRERFPKLELWERGEAKPTLKQLERFAKAVYVPIGYLFLPKPPVERIPIPDLRTVASRPMTQPSPDLLDVIYLCQRRQAWYREYAQFAGEEPLDFVGSARLDSREVQVAQDMRRVLNFGVEARRDCRSWTEALRRFIERAEDVGVLVMVSGIVGSNTHRGLDPEEFRGFALVDDLSPVVFINGADTLAARMFTLAHELAHLWLGQSALSDVGPASSPSQRIEAWCNRVAAEFLVPLDDLRRELTRGDPLPDVSRLAQSFKVSTLVILRRLLDARRISRETFDVAYQKEWRRLVGRPRSSGGDFYRTCGLRVSRRFARAIVVNTLEGHTSFTEAFRLLGLKKMATFREIGQRLEVGV